MGLVFKLWKFVSRKYSEKWSVFCILKFEHIIVLSLSFDHHMKWYFMSNSVSCCTLDVMSYVDRWVAGGGSGKGWWGVFARMRVWVVGGGGAAANVGQTFGP